MLCCPCIYLCIGEGEDEEEKREEESRRLSIVEDFLINQQQCWYLHDGGAECPAQGQSPMVQSSVLKSLQLKMKQKVTCEENKQMGRAGASEEINSDNSLSVFVPLSRRFQSHLKLRQESPSLGCNNGWTLGSRPCSLGDQLVHLLPARTLSESCPHLVFLDLTITGPWRQGPALSVCPSILYIAPCCLAPAARTA